MSGTKDGMELIGTLRVASGQVLLVDPADIDTMWVKEPFEDVHQYRHNTTGEVLEFRKDFRKYSDIIPAHNKSMSELNATGEWTPVPIEVSQRLSYNACAQTTVSRASAGQVAEVAVALSTVYGDGRYNVYANKAEDGGIMQVLIDFTVHA